ncbi:MAG: hypothetical protein ACRDRS_03305 [Pseudonocardiaceae bacterium]
MSSLRVDIEKCAGPLIVPEFDFTIRRGRFVEHRTVTIVIAAMGAWWLMTSVVTSVSRTPNNIAAGVGVAAVMAVVVVAYLIGAFAWSAARARRREAA